MKSKLQQYRFDWEGNLRMNKNRLRLLDEHVNMYRRKNRKMMMWIKSQIIRSEEDGN